MSTQDGPHPTIPRQLAAWAGRSALTVLFVAGWRYESWLIVVTMAAAAITLAASGYLAERTLAQRVAAWALFAPAGAVDGSELERAIAANLACVASGDSAVLEACCARVGEIPDPWLRSLASNNSRVTARARALTSTADRSRRETALTRLAAIQPAARLDALSLRRSTLFRAALCGAAVAATELV